MNHKIFHFFFLLMLLMGSTGVMAEDYTPDHYDSKVREHFRNGRWAAGKKLLDKAMPTYGTLSVMNELQGWYYYHFKKYTQARYYLIKSLRDDTSNQHARELLVNVEDETRNYSSAICYINEILEYNPYSKGWWRRKINIYRKMGNQQEADRLLLRLKQIYPNDTDVVKDLDYQMEQNLAAYKRQGNVDGMIASLRHLIKRQPKNVENYQQLCNLLLQQGRIDEAAEIAGQGARMTGNSELARKRIGILAEQGKYTEALAYLRECQTTLKIAGLGGLQAQLEEAAAENARNNDPYVMYGKLYERTHSLDALTYLLNTSMSRGYYEDALAYLKEMKRFKGNTFELQYKEYVVNKRLGNTLVANRMLQQLASINPKDSDLQDELCDLYSKQATDAMLAGSHEDAIPLLQYIAGHATEMDTRKSALKKIYNCYIGMRDYEAASEHLDKIRQLCGYTDLDYVLNKATLYKEQGKISEALNILAATYDATRSVDDRNRLSSYYEEIVLPRIKSLIEARMIKQAHFLASEAVKYCPDSYDVLYQAINTSGILGMREEYKQLIETARDRFPGNPYILVKEASLYVQDKDYETARQIIRPLLDTYVGDSTMINAYGEACNLRALELRKLKDLDSALVVINDGLEYKDNDREMYYTKGLIFEDKKMYDSAYFYQRRHVPDLMEVSEFKHHLEELMGKNYTNTLSFDYSHAVTGSNDKRTGLANVSYSKKYEFNSYDYTLGYAGRNGMADTANDADAQEPGGTGLQFGFSWTHQWKPSRSWTAAAALGTKYYPLLTLKGGLNFEELPIKWLNNTTFDVQPHASLRIMRSYMKMYKCVLDEEMINEGGIFASTDTLIGVFSRWKEKKTFLMSAGLTVTKPIEQFVLSAGADLYCQCSRSSSSLFYSVNGKMQFFPVDGNSSHVYVVGGFGTAPETSIIDNSMPGVFDHMNTYVGMGGMYLLNRHLSFALSGTWYTLYDSNERLANPNRHYTLTPFRFKTKLITKFENYFYINAQMFIKF